MGDRPLSASRFGNLSTAWVGRIDFSNVLQVFSCLGLGARAGSFMDKDAADVERPSKGRMGAMARLHRPRHGRTPALTLGLGAFVMALAVGNPVEARSGLTLPPFKDALFAYPEPTAISKDGTLKDVPYAESRDIDVRDEIPERRVRGAYVERLPSASQVEEVLPSPNGGLHWTRVGEIAGAKAIVVFVHGRNGDRRLGMNDWTFGGNFNRLKNLLTRAGGAYVTVDGGRLGSEDSTRVGHLIESLRARNETGRIVLACGSMGGELCWSLLTQAPIVAAIDGLVLLGANSSWDRFDALRKAEGGRDVPIVLAHGTRDKVYPLERQRTFFDAVRSRQPSYPIRMVVFDDGNHGTPIRMIDWRETLNWMLTR
ncbi:alpha/beta hydrolase family protein [Aureimonas sp. AU40]|uniref:alpha/beta hydrolase family protein n=1 Tax=Aureimonas sp. AU40 TaxID=1637747 RepID=UPI0012E3E7EC|nr:alpha/beta hydrolase [Aureimonas sp. AU40]